MARPRKPKWPPLPRRTRGTGSISRHQTTGVLRARLPRRVDPKRTAKEFPSDGLAAAQAWLDGRLHPIITSLAHSAQMTVRDWSGYWWKTYVDGVKTHNTARAYRSAIRKLRPVYAVPLADLRASRLKSILRGLQEAGLSAKTLALTLTAWRECFEAAIDDELLTRNPARRLAIEGESAAPIPRRALTVAELRILRAASVGRRFEVAYVLILECGLRFGEVHGLRWDHVDLDGAIKHVGLDGPKVHVEHQYTDGHWRPLPKGRNPHWAEIPPDVVAVLRRHQDRQPPGCVLVVESPRPHRRAQRGMHVPWSRGTIMAEFRVVVKAAGLADVVPHAARHGLASYWLERGVSLPEIARRLGHRRVDTTTGHYTHPTDESRDRASELIEDLFPDDQGGDLGGSADGPIESAS